MTSFAMAFRAARESRGLSVTACARALAVDASLVSRWEAATRHPTRPYLERAATVLGLDPLQTARLLVSAGYTPDAALILVGPGIAGQAVVAVEGA